MKIYTKTGDAGDTGLIAGARVRKDDIRIEAVGTVDELNAALGVVRTQTLPSDIDDILVRVQHTLFDMGAELASPDPVASRMNRIAASHSVELETAIDHFEKRLPALREFILPGGCASAAMLHLARAVCRRAERRVVTLMSGDQANVSANLVIYLNRLSDLLFVLARAANQAANQPDVAWRGTDPSS